MSNINREDINAQNELSRVMDLDDIDFEKLMNLFADFILNNLLEKENVHALNINHEIAEKIKNYALQGKAFIDGYISKDILTKERISAWDTYKELVNDDPSKKLLRIIICLLYDKEESEFDMHGSGEMLGVFFYLLLDLGAGYCNLFKNYLQSNL